MASYYHPVRPRPLGRPADTEQGTQLARGAERDDPEAVERERQYVLSLGWPSARASLPDAVRAVRAVGVGLSCVRRRRTGARIAAWTC